VRRRGLPPFAVGLGVLAVLAVGIYLGFTKEIPFRHQYTIEAVFPSASNIRIDSPVRVAGVNIGKVTRISHVEAGRQAALVTMRVDKKGLPLHRDARLKIRPRIFLEGNFFVDVSPGSPSAPALHDGDRIPINQTGAPVQLDQVLSALRGAGVVRRRQVLGGERPEHVPVVADRDVRAEDCLLYNLTLPTTPYV
jgi:phospholipid/cholesterol/gamma-HCH transport system substrate-binding protein